MITNIKRVDLTSTEAFLRELTRQSYTDKGERFAMSVNRPGTAPAVVLWNNGSGGEVILIEKMIIAVSADVEIHWGWLNDRTGFSVNAYGVCLKVGDAASTLGCTYYKDSTTMSGNWGKANILAKTPFQIDMGGILVPNGKGVGCSSSIDLTVAMTFIWREIA